MRVVSCGLAIVFSLIGTSEQNKQEDWADELKEPDLKKTGVEDQTWADYLKEIEPAYDESGFPEITTSDPANNLFVQNLNFSLTGRGEVPYMAIIYQFLEGETAEDGGARSGVRKNRACGGVLVATNRLITPCGCVVSYFGSFYVQIQIQEGEPPAHPYDLGWKTKGKYLFNKRLNRIFVQYGLTRFYVGDDMPGYKDPKDAMHLVDGAEEPVKNERAPVPTLNQECYDIAKLVWFKDGRPVSPSKRIIETADHALSLVPFFPEIKHPIPGQVIPWPPKVFNDETTQSRQPFYEEKVVVSAIGFKMKVFGPDCPRPWRIVDDEGNDLALDRISLNIPMLHCVIRTGDEETCKRSYYIRDQHQRLSCFCDLYEPKVVQSATGCRVIYSGIIGFPIVYFGNVVALTVSPRNPHVPGNRLLGSSLAYPDFMKHVEETLTKEAIWQQRTERPPMFREDVEHWSVVFYEYPEMPGWYTHAGTTPRLIQFAFAAHLSPHPAVSTLAPLVSLIPYLIYSDPK